MSKCYVEVMAGVEGPCLLICDKDGSGLRVAGPKAWGGGRVVHRFQVNPRELIKELEQYLPEGD